MTINFSGLLSFYWFYNRNRSVMSNSQPPPFSPNKERNNRNYTRTHTHTQITQCFYDSFPFLHVSSYMYVSPSCLHVHWSNKTRHLQSLWQYSIPLWLSLFNLFSKSLLRHKLYSCIRNYPPVNLKRLSIPWSIKEVKINMDIFFL